MPGIIGQQLSLIRKFDLEIREKRAVVVMIMNARIEIILPPATPPRSRIAATRDDGDGVTRCQKMSIFTQLPAQIRAGLEKERRRTRTSTGMHGDSQEKRMDRGRRN